MLAEQSLHEEDFTCYEGMAEDQIRDTDNKDANEETVLMETAGFLPLKQIH